MTKPRTMGGCLWCKTPRPYTLEAYPDEDLEPVPVQVCARCYSIRVRSPKGNPRFRMWSMASAVARRAGAVFKLMPGEVPEPYPSRCPVTKLKLEYRYPSRRNPPTDSLAVLVPVDPDKGYVRGNVRVVSRRAAEPPRTPPTREELAEAFRAALGEPPVREE